MGTFAGDGNDGPLEGSVRILIAALAFALLTQGAYAQGIGGPGGFGGGRKQQQQQKPDKEAKPKADDKAYNAALKGIPNKQYDPWHGVR